MTKTRRMVLAGVLGVAASLGAACTRAEQAQAQVVDHEAALRWPRLELRLTGGYHGGRWTLRVDREGHYAYGSSDEDGGGIRIERKCGGTLDAARTRAWIDRVAALPLVPHEHGVYRDMAEEHPSKTDAIRNEAFFVVYHPSADAAQMPADLAAYESVRDEAKGWFAEYGKQRSAWESCTTNEGR